MYYHLRQSIQHTSSGITGADWEYAMASPLAGSSQWPDAEFDRLFQRLAEDFNRARPIVVLPPEILVLIFSFLSLSSLPTRSRSRIDLGWIRVTHVCRRWREVALSASILWTRVDDLGPYWTALCLERARNAPLRLLFFFPSSRTFPKVRDIADRFPQFRQLEIQGTPKILRPITDRLHSPAPRLESLHVAVSGIRLPNHQGQVIDVVEVRGPLLGGNSPSLRHLSLQNVFFQWSTFRFSDLVSLTLVYKALKTYEPAKEMRLPSVSALFATLSTMLNLRTLCLHRFMRMQVGEALPKPITLPHLGFLDLGGSATECLILQRGLIADSPRNRSPTVFVSCAGTTTRWEAGEIDALLDICMKLSSKAGDMDKLRRLNCRITASGGQGGLFVQMMDFDSDGQIFHLKLPDIEGWDGPDWLRILKILLSTLPRDCICALELNNEMALSNVQWTEAFASVLPLPQLEIVMISEDFRCKCLPALLDLDVHGIPKMREIILDADEIGLHPGMVEQVADSVRACRQRGVPLQCIKLRGSIQAVGMRDWEDMLRTVVPQFERQGIGDVSGIHGPGNVEEDLIGMILG
ncbi:hypothetical protein EVG20_g4097 [Dentipellis fragilis]|uniref:F-box domain-containing protein n=1 Tax=Dentipellis fragilis TaxID=205917 RepID=A0A4Y9Z0U7_9AGAM|nr:hypothetical protein EVG20_g4097 [Dentipellis fragilis]